MIYAFWILFALFVIDAGAVAQRWLKGQPLRWGWDIAANAFVLLALIVVGVLALTN